MVRTNLDRKDLDSTGHPCRTVGTLATHSIYLEGFNGRLRADCWLV